MLHFIDATNRHEPRYADMLEQSYRIRHDIFVAWRGWKALERPDGREIDQFDTLDAKYVLWADGDEVLGGARFVESTKPHLLSEVFPHIITLQELPREPRVWEGTRFFTSRTGNSKVNRRGVTKDVFRSLFEVGLKYDLKAITMMCDTFFLPRLLEGGVEAIPLSLPTPYAEGTCIACLLPVSLQQLAAARAGDRHSVLYHFDTSAAERVHGGADATVHAH